MRQQLAARRIELLERTTHRHQLLQVFTELPARPGRATPLARSRPEIDTWINLHGRRVGRRFGSACDGQLTAVAGRWH
jgi:hypothetical protein